MRTSCSVVLALMVTGCMSDQDASPSGCDIAATEEAHVAVVVAAPAPPAPRACQWNAQCEGLSDSRRPACTARYNNLCYCSAALARDGSCPRNKGVCVFHADAATDNCICVPGSIEVGPCTGGKVRKCANSGTSWGTCT